MSSDKPVISSKAQTDALTSGPQTASAVLKQTNYESIPPIEKELECAICTDICVDPVMTSCGHLFCKQCLQNINNNICPTCREALSPEKIRDLNSVQDRPICNMIARVIVRCKFCKGTTARGLKGELFNKHWYSECSYPCSHKCGETLTRSKEADHLLICPFVEVPCCGNEYGCTEICARKDIKTHEDHCTRAKLTPYLDEMKKKTADLEKKLEVQGWLISSIIQPKVVQKAYERILF
jgi:hypothetical protein